MPDPDPIATAAEFTRRLDADVRSRLDAENLTLTRYTTLARAEGVTGADLAPYLGVTAQMVSKTAHELRLLGYLSFSPNDQDKRQRVMHVTDTGRDVLSRAASALNLPPALLAAMESYLTSTP